MTGDRGAGSVLMFTAVAIVAVVAVAVASLGVVYAARAKAQVAADAAALAAAVATYPAAGSSSPVVAASSIARDNGASLIGCQCTRSGALTPRSVAVVTAVQVRLLMFGEVRVKASSRAEFDPRAWLGR